MKRIQEKVKDVIEVRSYKNLQDFISDPAQTLSAYHFTDVTSVLMAKWLEKVADVEIENGAAKALAGYRGVGKSHFLATLGAIISQPELRSRITEPLVTSGAQRLKRRRYQVSYVRRGTHSTLLDEIKDSIAKTFEFNLDELSDSLSDLLNLATARSGDLPFVLMIDTAFERTSRVSRDDGVLLGEIAELAKDLNMFVAVALDDDISGADGVNAAIARNFSIDYLDQEHLYRIVDTHIFPKNRQYQTLLHDIYTYFREVLPSFRWSEQRFTSLYPMHPMILELAPFVRLYAPDFALLGFASETGRKILGRPANSLVALDEVFDIAETSLRKIKDLNDAFAIYDRLNQDVVSNIPVMQRLHAKLVLKGLLLLSLDGDGTTASEVCAAMLIFDETEPQKAIRSVEELLETFVSVLPDDVRRMQEEGREIRYSLSVGGRDSLNTVLGETALSISEDVIPKVMRRLAREKFSDWNLPDDESIKQTEWSDCQIVWRGGLRRGRLFWNLENEMPENPTVSANSELLDWEVFVSQHDKISANSNEPNEIPKVVWQPAQLRKDETETILRYYVLLYNMELREEYGEQIRAAGHTYSLAVEKIWNRIFLQDAKLVIDGFDYNFTEESRNAQTLSEVFTTMLEPLFEIRYPAHPVFEKTLGMNEVSSLVSDLFSGARQDLSEVQKMAEIYALPLGLVARRGENFILETEEHLANLPMAQEILSLVRQKGEETVSLKTIYRNLKQSPNGLVREAQHLILTALVAQRQIEFVTTKGDRINRRSLDLKIIWDDIEGIGKPISILYAPERLTDWARILTGSDAFQSIDSPEDRLSIRNAFEIWLSDWKTSRLLERFNELPDEILNTKIWRIATRAEKTFGTVSSTVGVVLEENISLDEGLHRIADAFSDSEEEFLTCTKDLVILEDFINGAARRQEIWTYLAVCENTEDEKIEYFREKLLEIIEETYSNPNEKLNYEMGSLWQSFHTRYTEHFAIKHDTVMKSHLLQEKFDEIKRSDEWWEFENLSSLPIFPRSFWQESQRICQQFKELDCRFDVREMLNTHPFCACSFNLAQIREWERLPQTLWETINQGRKSYRKVLLTLGQTLIPSVKHFSAKNNDGEFKVAAANLIEIFNNEQASFQLTGNEMIILEKIFESLPNSPLMQVNFPSNKDFVSREELSLQINKWLDELPNEPVLLKA